MKYLFVLLLVTGCSTSMPPPEYICAQGAVIAINVFRKHGVVFPQTSDKAVDEISKEIVQGCSEVYK